MVAIGFATGFLCNTSLNIAGRRLAIPLKVGTLVFKCHKFKCSSVRGSEVQGFKFVCVCVGCGTHIVTFLSINFAQDCAGPSPKT